jgi:hypothetical protein
MIKLSIKKLKLRISANSKFRNFYFEIIFSKYRKTPLLVPGVDQFSNSNSFELDQLVA